MGKDFYCPILWNSVAIRNNGDYRICCNSNISKSAGLLKEGDTPLNIGKNSVEDIRNHEMLKEIRQHFFEGKWHSACTRCKTDESHSQRSGRMHAIDRLLEKGIESSFQDDVAAFTKSDGTIDAEKFPIHELDIRFGNKCNLSCRSCSPHDSTGWYTDHYKLGRNTFDDLGVINELEVTKEGRVVATKDNYSWFKNVSLISALPKDLSKLTRLYFAGGEPLINKEHQTFLEELVAIGLSKNIELEYNTNLSVLPDAIIELWSHFKFVGVGVSMDGYGAFHEYLRHPLSFKVIERNLQKLDNANVPLRGWLACTISSLNISHLPDFIIWKHDQHYKQINNNLSRPPISVHLLHHPLELNIRSIPQRAKELIAARIKVGIERIRNETSYDEDKLESTQNMLEGLVRYMMAVPPSEQWSEYWQETLRLDELRNQTFASLDPELYAIFQEESLAQSSEDAS